MKTNFVYGGIISVILVSTIVGMVYVFLQNNMQKEESGFGGLGRHATEFEKSDEIDSTKQTKIFVVALDGTALSQNIEGETIGCNDKLFAIDLEKSVSPRDALISLFDYTGDESIYNAFENTPIIINSFEIDENGLATVKLSANSLGGGMCDTPRIVEQLNKTLLQFDDINNTKIYFNDKPIEEYLSEKD